MNRFSDRPISIKLVLPMVSFLAMVPSLVFGQERLSLNDVVREGLVNNYSIQVSKNETMMSSRNVSYGNAGFLPSVSAYGSLDKASYDSQVKVVSGAELDTDNAKATVTTAGLKAEWILFDGARMFAEYDKLKTSWRISDLETRVTMENVVYKIIIAYSDIIRHTVLLDACAQRLKSSNLRYSIAHNKFKTGLGSEQEWLQSGVARQADSTSYIRQLSSLKKSKIALNELMCTNVQRDYTTDDTIPLVSIPELDELITSSKQFNNELRINTEHLIYGKQEVKSLQSGRYPKLSLSGSYGFYENDTEAAFIKFNRYYGPQIGLSLGMKLFDGLRLNKSIQNAKTKVQNRELLQKDMELQISAIVAQTYLDYKSQLLTISLGKEGLKLAEKNNEIAMKAYKSGMISSLDLRVAQEDLYQAKSSLANASFDAKISETDLLRVSGMLIK